MYDIINKKVFDFYEGFKTVLKNMRFYLRKLIFYLPHFYEPVFKSNFSGTFVFRYFPHK